MNHGESLSIQPGEVADATTQLGDLADRVTRVMATEAPNLAPEPSARDEVSQRVAATLNEVHASFGKTSDQGQQQLRRVVEALRTHAGNLVAADDGLAV
jgi:ElaB/YqjD/DUF883 family membrane-anchored ribosome-binding protein